VSITILYVLLVTAVCALLAAGIGFLLRVRRLSRASSTQFMRAMKEEEARVAETTSNKTE
jgi:hypothetical protein